MLCITTLVWGHPKANDPTNPEHHKFFNKKQILSTVADVAFAALVLTVVVLVILQSFGINVGLNALTLSSTNAIIVGSVVGGSVLLMLAMNLGIGMYRQWKYVKELKDGLNTHVEIREGENDDDRVIGEAEDAKLRTTAEGEKEKLDDNAEELGKKKKDRIAELEAQIVQLEAEVNRYNAIFASLNEEHEKAVAAIRKEMAELAQPQAEGREKEEDNAVNDSEELQQLRDENEALRQQLGNVQSKSCQVEETESAVLDAKEKVKAKKAIIKDLRKEIEVLKAEHTKLQLATASVEDSGRFEELIEHCKANSVSSTPPVAEKTTSGRMRFADFRKKKLDSMSRFKAATHQEKSEKEEENSSSNSSSSSSDNDDYSERSSDSSSSSDSDSENSGNVSSSSSSSSEDEGQGELIPTISKKGRNSSDEKSHEDSAINFSLNPEAEENVGQTEFLPLPTRNNMNGNGYTSTTTSSFKAEPISTNPQNRLSSSSETSYDEKAHAAQDSSEGNNSDDDWEMISKPTTAIKVDPEKLKKLQASIEQKRAEHNGSLLTPPPPPPPPKVNNAPTQNPPANGQMKNVFDDIKLNKAPEHEYSGNKPLENCKETNGGPPPLPPGPPPAPITFGEGEKEQLTPMEELMHSIPSLNDRRGKALPIGSKDLDKMSHTQTGLTNPATRNAYREVFEGIKTWCEEKKDGKTNTLEKIRNLNDSLFDEGDFFTQPFDGNGTNSLYPHTGDSHEKVGYASTVYEEVHKLDHDADKQKELLNACEEFVANEVLPLIESISAIALESTTKNKLQSGELFIRTMKEELKRALKEVTEPKVDGQRIHMKEFGNNLVLMENQLSGQDRASPQTANKLAGVVMGQEVASKGEALNKLREIKKIHGEIINLEEKINSLGSQREKLEEIEKVRNQSNELKAFIGRLMQNKTLVKHEKWEKLATLPVVTN